jgi:hypothetical protein
MNRGSATANQGRVGAKSLKQILLQIESTIKKMLPQNLSNKCSTSYSCFSDIKEEIHPIALGVRIGKRQNLPHFNSSRRNPLVLTL